MIKTSEALNQLIRDSKKYLDNKIDLIKLDSAEKLSSLLCAFFSIMIVGFVFSIFVILFSISLVLFFSSLLNSIALAYLIVALLYFIIGVVLLIKREQLIRYPLMNFLLSHLFKKTD